MFGIASKQQVHEQVSRKASEIERERVRTARERRYAEHSGSDTQQ